MPTTTTSRTAAKKSTTTAKAPKVKGAVAPSYRIIGSDADGWKFQCTTDGCGSHNKRGKATSGILTEDRPYAEFLGEQHVRRAHGFKKGSSK